VVRDRLLHKTAVASSLLRERFLERRGEITDLGSLEKTRRVYRTPTEENFADFYPYLPWMIDTIPNIVKGIAQAANRSEALTGSNRTMIGVVQGGIIDTPGLLARPVGSLISLADLYNLLSSDAPSETKTDIARIQDQASGAGEFTTMVARALYLLNQDEYIQSNLHNLTLALVNGLDYDLNSERARVKNELDRLIAAGYVKQVGEIFIFLSTQQRTFQDKVRRREQQWNQKNYDLSQQLKFFEKDDALRFGQVPMQGQPGREKLVKVELDWGIVYYQNESVRVRVFTPLQYYLDRDLEDDATMRQKSNQDPNTFFFRLGQSKNLHRALARFVATREAVDEVLSSPAGNDPEKRVALQAREKDLPVYERDVRYYLGQSVEEGKIFLRGSSYDLADGDNPQEMVRNTLKHFLFGTIYTLFQNVPHRISNEATAVKAALSGNTTHPDLVALKIYNSDGTLNESSALISTLKGMLPLDEEGRGTVSAEELRQRIEQPPYGWDGHAVRIGLALLLRVSQCRLQENSAYLSDPQNPDVAEALTKASRFKALRVQGVRSDLKGPELQEIRGYIQDVFGLSKLSVAAPTLNSVLDEQFKSLQEQALLLKEWAATAVCPLPAGFGAGHDLVEEMLNETAAAVRLPHFKSEWQAVALYRQLLQDLTGFKNEHGQLYIQIREFFSLMSYIEEAPDAVKTFLADWRVLRDEQAITNASRWNDLLTTYRAASQAHAEQTASMVQEVCVGEARLRAELVAQLASAGLPAEHLGAEQANLEQTTGLQRLQADLAQSTIGYTEARRLRGELAKARVNLPVYIREARLRYQPQPAAQPPVPRPEVHIAWHSLLGEHLLISSLSDLEQALRELRRSLENELADGRIVILD
jgi:hypothetical protein